MNKVVNAKSDMIAETRFKLRIKIAVPLLICKPLFIRGKMWKDFAGSQRKRQGRGNVILGLQDA